MAALGRACRVQVPLTEAFLTICGVINGVDYLEMGLALSDLGLSAENLTAQMAAL